MVTVPSSIWSLPVIGWPLVVGGSTESAAALQAEHGDHGAVDRKLAEPEAGPAGHRGLAVRPACSSWPGGQFPYPPSAWIRTSQFQPYRTGWRDQAGQAGAEHGHGRHRGHGGDGSEQDGPHRDRALAGSRLPARCGCPATAEAGRPADAGRPRDHRRPARRPGPAGGRIARPARWPAAPARTAVSAARPGAEHQAVRPHPARRVELPHRADRGQRRQRDRAGHGDDHAAERWRGRPAGWPPAPPGARVAPSARAAEMSARGPAQQLRHALADEHQHGQRGDRAEDRQRDRPAA